MKITDRDRKILQYFPTGTQSEYPKLRSTPERISLCEDEVHLWRIDLAVVTRGNSDGDRFSQRMNGHEQRVFILSGIANSSQRRARSLHQFDVSLKPGDLNALLATRPDPAAATEWSLREIPVCEGYAAALCVRGHGWRLKF